MARATDDTDRSDAYTRTSPSGVAPSAVFPKKVMPRRHLSLKLTAVNWSWIVFQEKETLLSPGATIAVDWHLLRFFSLGLSGTIFVGLDHWNAHQPAIVHSRCGFVPRFSIPIRSDFFFSVGLAMGNDLGILLNPAAVGGGFFGAGIVGIKAFFGEWGMVLDIQSGFDYLWGPEWDAMITMIQGEVGAVYRF